MDVIYGITKFFCIVGRLCFCQICEMVQHAQANKLALASNSQQLSVVRTVITVACRVSVDVLKVSYICD